MVDYKALYRDDPRFHRYVDATAEAYGRTVEETLELKAVRNVGDYYAKNPPKEETTVSTMKSGGC